MKTTAVAALAGMVVTCFAGGPVDQKAKFGSIVRVMSGIPDKTTLGTFLGTGTVIANKNVNGKGWLAVLTADHVVSKTENAAGATIDHPGIGLGSAITGATAGLPAGYVGRMGGQKVDLAVLGIEYGAYDPTLKAIRTIADVDTANAPASFTSLGYGFGLTPDPMKNEWVSDGVAGDLRFYNNKKYTISAGNVATFGGYENQVVKWSALAPGDADAMKGQGVTFKGDSGGPMFVNTPDKETINGEDIPIMTNGIFAVNHAAVFRVVGGKAVAIGYGKEINGVFLNKTYRNWIDGQVAAVPEPCTIIAVGLGLAAIAARRPHRLTRQLVKR